MPFVKVSYNQEKYTQEELSLISENILNSLVEIFFIPPKDYFQIFNAHKQKEIYYNKEYLINSIRTDRILYIQITCGPGRTVEQKKSLYMDIATRLFTSCKIAKEDVFIILNETPLENWSFGDGIAQMIS
ncbi:MAG: tautomerase family protein [Velocimicrobium sp.]